MIVDINYLIDRYGVHKSTIGEWVKKYPHVKAGQNEYILEEMDLAVITIYKDKLNNYCEVNRLKIAQAVNFELKNELLRIEIDKIKSGVITEPEAKEDLIGTFKIYRSYSLDMAESISEDLAKLETPKECRDLLERSIFNCLSEIHTILGGQPEVSDNDLESGYNFDFDTDNSN